MSVSVCICACMYVCVCVCVLESINSEHEAGMQILTKAHRKP